MLLPNCRTCAMLGFLLMLTGTAGSLAADFPYEEELLLEAAPMPGSKRVPILEVQADGTASIDLWCNTVPAQFVVAGETVTVITGEPTKNTCDPARMRADEALLAALQKVSGWQMDDTVLTLRGDQDLRFHLSTH